MDHMSFDPQWPLIALIAILLMGPSLMALTFLGMTDSLLAPTSAVFFSFVASWALCVFVLRFKRRLGQGGM